MLGRGAVWGVVGTHGNMRDLCGFDEMEKDREMIFRVQDLQDESSK